jgi:hypothetical protein
MTPPECAAYLRWKADQAGITVEELARRIDHATHEEIAQSMETLPTDALEWAVRFEALSHPADDTFPPEAA